MQIYVGKSGQQLGPFSLEEINRKLADGTFVGSDLAWYEGAAGWAPLSGVAGVVIPAPAARTPLAASPPPGPMLPVPAPAPVAANTAIVQPPRSRTKVLAVVSWVLLGVTLIVSFIPFVGCGAWGLVWPVAAATIIMGVIIVVRGATAQGIFIILAAILMIPIGLFAPVLTTALAVGAVERKQETQILANLRQIDAAKTSWAAETRAALGAPVTMANLTSQLAGKEVKPVVDETYDPMPVGQPATARLPANKTLGPFSGSDVLTAASVEKALANSSTFSWNVKKSTTTSFFSATPAPSLSPTPRLSTSPSASPSPAASVSPKSSAPPHSLISPRQQVEPEESPSSPQSPSGKFAPRNGPRQNPSPSDDNADAEKSGGLKQGRQFPRQSPGATPEKSPDDDDD